MAASKKRLRGSTVAVNRRAGYDYELLDRYDAGIELVGTEIKSIREGNMSLAEGYARFKDGELWLYDVHIAGYAPARENHEPRRPRRLLLHRRELDRMQRELGQQPRTTVIPLRMYLYNGLAKVEIALARGRRSWDRRQAIAQRDANRAIQRGMRQEQR
ncbi:MAG: SsrA-binding protein SmpB [Dehalococcoidia bacterium]